MADLTVDELANLGKAIDMIDVAIRVLSETEITIEGDKDVIDCFMFMKKMKQEAKDNYAAAEAVLKAKQDEANPPAVA